MERSKEEWSSLWSWTRHPPVTGMLFSHLGHRLHCIVYVDWNTRLQDLQGNYAGCSEDQ